jgi:Family of unknown function (DUF6491)
MSDSKFGQGLRLCAVAGMTLGLGLGLASVVGARPANDAANATELQPAFEEVTSFTIQTHLHSWHAIDEDTVIVWATPFQPYLVELSFPSHDLQHSEAIGITSVGNRVYARFDSLRVAGFRYPIDSIYKMTREEARNLARGT